MNKRTRQSGLSYVEFLVATVILVVALLPAADTLQVAMRSGEQSEIETERHFRLQSRMEEMLAEAYGILEAEAIAVGDATVPTSFSDAPGVPNRRLVFLALYDGDDADADGDPFTGGDPGLVWIRVVYANSDIALESLKYI